MSSVAINPSSARRRRACLDEAARGVAVHITGGFLMLDAVAAIGFAGGLAGAVASIVARSSLLPWLALLLAAGVTRAGTLTLAARAGASSAQQAKARLRRRIAAAVLHRTAEAGSIGGALNTIVDEVEAIEGYIARFLPARFASAAAPLLILCAIALASPVSAAILTLTLIPFIAAMILAGGAAADESRRQFTAMARLSGIFVDRIRALPIVLAFDAGEREAARIGIAAGDVADRTLRVLARAFLSSAALEFFASLSVALVAVYAGFALLGLLPFRTPEHLTLARAFFVLALAPEFYAPLRRLAAAYHDRQAAETVAERLTGIEEVAVQPARPLALTPTAAPALRFENVAITYPGAYYPAVAGFSLDIGAGETIALVGPSGAGKSSILKLLLGLSPLSAGLVSVDGMPLAPGGMVGAAYVGQSPILIAGSLAENIALGRPDAENGEIMAAARAAGLAPLIARRAQGLNCWLDERGGGLSGGERRRVALARALLTQAKLLLLDEPTAHLNVEAEARLIATLVRQKQGRTMLIATHSRAVAGIADRVVEISACR